jgi:hypothetical protein
MSGITLSIVLASAFLHAGWNYLLKKSERKIVFIWWFLLMILFALQMSKVSMWRRSARSALSCRPTTASSGWGKSTVGRS